MSNEMLRQQWVRASADQVALGATGVMGGYPYDAREEDGNLLA